jgi:transposase-like protein
MKCPKCLSKKTVRYGTQPSKIGRLQKYQCQICAHIFVNKKEVING